MDSDLIADQDSGQDQPAAQRCYPTQICGYLRQHIMDDVGNDKRKVLPDIDNRSATHRYRTGYIVQQHILSGDLNGNRIIINTENG